MASVANESEVLETLKRGSKNRTVVATAMNDVSSRSHLILSVYVMAKNSITGKDTMGKLHLIDLYRTHQQHTHTPCIRCTQQRTYTQKAMNGVRSLEQQAMKHR